MDYYAPYVVKQGQIDGVGTWNEQNQLFHTGEVPSDLSTRLGSTHMT